jgi:ribosomal protein S18 acetylase RimI-like enzyme
MTHAPDLRRIEELGLNSSAPPGQLLYDGWLLRLLPGQAKRARSVNAVYPSTLALAHKIGYCEQLYRAHKLPLIFRITPFSEPATLDAELEHLAYPRFDTTAVEAATIDPAPWTNGDVQRLDLPEWVQAVGTLRDSPALARSAHLARLQGSLLPQRALVVRQAGRIVAAGLVIVEDGWAGLFDIVTAPAARQQGLGRRIVEGLLRAAMELGARQAYLQVGADNTPARRLYAHYGFRQCYQYWYRGHSD